MKVMFISDRPDAFIHGIWWHRIQTPADALTQRGHAVKQVAIGSEFPEELLEWPDVVIFGRTYPNEYNPVKWMKEFKARGKRVIYDMDDDFWQVAKDNPSKLVASALKDQYEGMIQEADAVVTPSKVLAKKFKKYFKKQVFICPNGVDPEIYRPRAEGNTTPVVGYMGAASHWKDLQLIGEVVADLHKKYDFIFAIYGLVGEPLEASMFMYNRYMRANLTPEKNAYYKSALDFYDQIKDIGGVHIPFMPPELHPTILSKVNFDIGLAPLEDNAFNNGKSCVKYYEYASVGTACVASDVLPYSDEVKYRAKNTKKDWYKKIEKLLVDEEFRNKLAKEQYEWVMKNRSTKAIGVEWELALQRPTKGPSVLIQEREA